MVDHPARGALSPMPGFLVVLLLPLLCQARSDMQGTEQAIQGQKAELQALRRQLAAGRQRVKALEGQARHQQDAVQQVRANEQLAQQVLQKIDQAEGQYRKLLEESNHQLGEAQNDLQDRRVILAQRVRRIWMRGRPDPGLAWLGQDNPDEWLRRRKAFQAVVDADTRLLSQVKRRGEVLSERVQAHRRRVAGLQEIETQKQDELAALGRNRVGEEQKLAVLQDKAQTERDRLKKLEASQAAIAQLLQTLENRRKAEEKRQADLVRQQKKWEQDQQRRAQKAQKAQKDKERARKAGKAPPPVEPDVAEAPPPPPPPKPSRSSLPQGAAPARKGMCWPVHGQILSRFGLQKNPVLGTTTRNLGIEVSGNQGQPVLSASGGKVAAILHLPGRGTTLVLEHPGGYFTLYGHLSRVLVREGADVTACREIAQVGSDESDNGAKLYFELRKGLSALDPLEWLTR